VFNALGSWYDAHIAQPIYLSLLDHTPDGYFLVADTAFLRGEKDIDGRIKAPIKSGSILPADPNKREAFLAFN